MNKAILTLAILACSLASLDLSPRARDGHFQGDKKQGLQRETAVPQGLFALSKKFRRRLC